jgi:hypothetical protein
MKALKTNIFLLGLIACFHTQAISQNLFPSRVKIETKIADSTWYASSNAGIVQVNEGSNEIAFKLDVSSVIVDVQKVDSALSNMGKQLVYLKGSFPIKNLSFTGNDNENQQDYSGKALLTINNITKEVSYTCEVYNFNNNDEFAVGNNVYPLRIGLFFDFDPVDFQLDKVFKPLAKTIKVEISNGFINRSNLGGDSIFPK